ncbi:MAG: integrase core domain-containing protein [Actinobacteria bacterium]|nr:integrase core domain-containing protein [Actinomycetota bacterium]
MYFTQEFLAFKGVLGMGAIVLSPGHPERNAVAESFFASLKAELVNRRRYRTRAQARSAIFR